MKRLLIWALGFLLLLSVIVGVNITPTLADTADLYWVGGTGSWSDTAHWATVSGGGGGHAVPTSTNNVYFDGNSAGTVTISTGTSYACKNLDFTGSGANSLIFACTSSASETRLNVYGSFTYDDGVTLLNWSTTDSIYIAATGTITSDAGNMISTGVTYDGGFQLVINAGGGTVTLGDDVTIGQFRWLAGTFDTNGQTLTTICGFYGGGQTYGDTVVMDNTYYDNGSFAHLEGANTFNNLTITNDDKYDGVGIYADQVVSGTLTLTGTAVDVRLMITSNTTTQRTITAATVVSQYTDFCYIIGAGAGDWDLSSAGENAIDFSGNSGITFYVSYDANRDMYWTGDADDGGGDNWTVGVAPADSEHSYNWSTTSGGAGGAARLPNPTATNDVLFDANSGFSIGDEELWISDGVSCKDIDFTGSGAVTPPIVYAAGDVNIYGSITFIAGMDGVYAGSGGGTWILSGTGTITSGGAYFDQGFVSVLEIDASGTYTMADDLTFSGTSCTFTYTSGTFDTNSQVIYYVGTATGTLYFYGGGQSYDSFICTTNGTVRVVGENTFGTFQRIGSNSFTDSIQFADDQVINTALVWQGYNISHRLQVGSSVVGTQRQITVNGTALIEYCDISDIAGVGTFDWDVSAGFNSDMGFNLGITFTVPQNNYWVGNSGNWSDPVHWASTSGGVGGTGRVPLVQDTAIFDAYSTTIPSRTITIDITNLSSIDASDAANNPTFSKTGEVDIYGSIDFGTITWSVTSTYLMGFNTTLINSNGTSTITTNLYIMKTAMTMSSAVLTSDFTITGVVYLRSGILALDEYTLTATSFDSSTTTYERAWNGGTGGIFILNGTAAGNKWNVASTNLLTVAGDSIIIFTNSGTNGQTFVGGNQTYNDFIIMGAGVYTTTISGTNTFGDVSIDRSQAAKTLTGSVTMTIDNLYINIAGTTQVTITNTDFIKTTGLVASQYLTISGSSAAGGATFLAGAAPPSTDGGGNSGWVFSNAVDIQVTTYAADGMTDDSAFLRGGITNMGSYNGQTVYAYFEYGTDVTYGNETYEQEMTAIGNFYQNQGGLSVDTEYHYRAVVRYGGGLYAYGADIEFQTTGAPTIETLDATDIALSTATLQGSVTSLGVYSEVYVRFEYGLTAGYGHYTGWQLMKALAVFEADIETLELYQTYHFRALGVYGSGTYIYGADNTFTTQESGIGVGGFLPPDFGEGGVPENIVPLTGDTDIYESDMSGLTTNPLYPAVNAIAPIVGFGTNQLFIFGAAFLTLLLTVGALFVVRGHALASGAVCLVSIGFFSSFGIFPYWLLIFGVIYLLVTLVMERQPSL